MIFLTLPRELVERILLLLDAKYMLTCRLVNRKLNEIIQSSILLQYFLACEAAGVIDNPRSPLSYGERLEALLKREDAWRMLKPVFETTVKVNHQSYGVIYGLNEGAFFLDDKNSLTDLHYCLFPSSPHDNPQWNRIQGHAEVINFAAAVYEHDLIIEIISSVIGHQADTQWYALDLVLLKFSTGEHHLLARHPRIHVQTFQSLPEDRPWVRAEIVGDNFAFIVQDGTFPDKLFIFDWKTGYRRLQHEATKRTYSDLVFVSPEILLVVNRIVYFEVWHLPPSHPNPKPPVQILALQIPGISPDYSLNSIGFNGEPNPFLHSMSYSPSRPFFPSRENSIIITSLYLDSFLETGSKPYTLIIPRRALLDTIQKWTSLSLCGQIEDLPMWLTKEVTVHKIVDPDDGSVRLDAQSKSVSTTPHPKTHPRIPGSPTFGASPTSPTADSGSLSISSGSSTTSSTTQYNFLQVQWTDWGPPISRWLQESEDRYIMGSTGLRYAFSAPNPRDRSKLMVSVADFNQYNLRRDAAQLRAGEGKNRGTNGNNEKGKEQVEEEELERLDHEGVFLEDIYMGLKCAVYHAPDVYDFNTGFMDEQRLLGLKLNGSIVESIKVLYFG